MAGLSKVKGSGLATGAATASLVGIDDNATSTAITIDASEQVGIGTTSPAAELHISKSADAGNAEIILENSFTNTGSSTDESTQIQGRFGGYDASYILTGKEGDYTTAALRKSYLAFSTRTATTGMTEKLRIDSSGNVEVKTGNLVIGTNGKGIDFSANADSSATGASTTSELLDDYEEGTWTATITTNGTDFSTSSRGTNAFYRKIGSQVTVWFGPSITSPTSGTGSLIVTGLPFTANHSAGMSITSGDIHFGRVDLIGTEGYFMQIAHNTSNIAFYYRIDNSNPGTMTADELNGNTTPYISGTLTYTAT